MPTTYSAKFPIIIVRGINMNKDRAAQSETTSYNTIDLGQYVISLRESVGWSQADLARHTGIDPADLSKMERNNRKVTATWLLIFQEAVQREKTRLRKDQRFASMQEQRFYDRYVIGMMNDMEALGMSDSKIEGVRETMSGFIKSVFAI